MELYTLIVVSKDKEYRHIGSLSSCVQILVDMANSNEYKESSYAIRNPEKVIVAGVM